jgi:hypothetical protein
MADQDSGLPIRSESDGADEKVIVKVIDGTNGGSNQMSVDSDKNAHVEVHGNNPAGTDEVLRLSELGAVTPDGVYHATDNSKPGNVGIITSVRDASPSDTTQTQRLTSITNGNKRLLDISLHDEDGAVYSTSNPLPVTSVDSEGDEINNYNTAASVAAGGTSNHDYTVTAAKTLKLTQIWAAASGKMKIEVRVETAAGAGTFVTRFVGFNSTANPNIHIPLKETITVATGVIVRIIRTNNDNQAQDLYSTISGHEI